MVSAYSHLLHDGSVCFPKSAFICAPPDWKKKKKWVILTFPRGRRRHLFCTTVDCTSVYYGHVASSWKSNNGNNFTLTSPTRPTLQWPRLSGCLDWSIASEAHVLGSTGRKQIQNFIFSEVPPSCHASIHCAHTCVKLKLSWPYIWLRMLFLLLKGFISRNISGDTFSRFGGRGLAGEIATRRWHVYCRRCQQAEMAAEPMRIGARECASTQTCLWVSIFIRCVERNPIMILSVGINESDLYQLLAERPRNGENSVEKRV